MDSCKTNVSTNHSNNYMHQVINPNILAIAVLNTGIKG